MQASFGIWEFATILFITAFLLWHFWISRRHWQDILLEGTEQSHWDDDLILILARGGGLGLLPKAPGTWGSLGGLAWTALLLMPGNAWVFLGGTLLGIALSIWICGRAEKLLGQTDPGEIVLDEIAALPLCYIGLLVTLHFTETGIPPLADLIRQPTTWYWVAAGFAMFRLFDIWKPTPIRQLQSLPSGWGVTLDDLMAAFYTALALHAAWLVLN